MALLVGFKAAQSIAFSLRKPFVGINHHEAHLYSPWISSWSVGGPPPPTLRYTPISPPFNQTFHSSSAADTRCW
jgi:hypothetical protein